MQEHKQKQQQDKLEEIVDRVRARDYWGET